MMMEINLLPHREARRAADLRETIALLVLGLVVLAGGIFFMNKSIRSEVAVAEANVAQLEVDIARYKRTPDWLNPGHETWVQLRWQEVTPERFQQVLDWGMVPVTMSRTVEHDVRGLRERR